MSRPRSPGRRPLRALAAGLLLPLLAGCSPLYVIKAGIAEARILTARRPIPDVILDPTTDSVTRGKLVLALEARAWAADTLGLDVGDSYASYAHLDSDTLAMVLSAAPRDRLVNKTWWFPIVGSVPYRGFFSLDDALQAQHDLEGKGFDTYLRPTTAFSTLGWFADPLLSTVVRQDAVDLIETIMHEVAHNTLWAPGHVGFNESYADFVGRVGAISFFCGRQGGGPDTVKCQRSRARWRDDQRFSVFIDGLVAELDDLYADSTVAYDQKLERRSAIFAAARRRFVEEVQPTFEASSFSGFLGVPLNNATLLARMRYYHRLGDFQALLEAHGGSLRAAVGALKAGLGGVEDPWTLLPSSGGTGPPGP